MKVTMLALGAPLLFTAAIMALYSPQEAAKELGGVQALLGLWFFVGVPVTGLYWIVRLVRRATRDSDAAAHRS